MIINKIQIIILILLLFKLNNVIALTVNNTFDKAFIELPLSDQKYSYNIFHLSPLKPLDDIFVYGNNFKLIEYELPSDVKSKKLDRLQLIFDHADNICNYEIFIQENVNSNFYFELSSDSRYNNEYLYLINSKINSNKLFWISKDLNNKKLLKININKILNKFNSIEIDKINNLEYLSVKYKINEKIYTKELYNNELINILYNNKIILNYDFLNDESYDNLLILNINLRFNNKAILGENISIKFTNLIYGSKNIVNNFRINQDINFGKIFIKIFPKKKDICSFSLKNLILKSPEARIPNILDYALKTNLSFGFDNNVNSIQNFYSIDNLKYIDKYYLISNSKNSKKIDLNNIDFIKYNTNDNYIYIESKNTYTKLLLNGKIISIKNNSSTNLSLFSREIKSLSILVDDYENTNINSITLFTYGKKSYSDLLYLKIFRNSIDKHIVVNDKQDVILLKPYERINLNIPISDNIYFGTLSSNIYSKDKLTNNNLNVSVYHEKKNEWKKLSFSVISEQLILPIHNYFHTDKYRISLENNTKNNIYIRNLFNIRSTNYYSILDQNILILFNNNFFNVNFNPHSKFQSSIFKNFELGFYPTFESNNKSHFFSQISDSKYINIFQIISNDNQIIKNNKIKTISPIVLSNGKIHFFINFFISVLIFYLYKILSNKYTFINNISTDIFLKFYFLFIIINILSLLFFNNKYLESLLYNFIQILLFIIFMKLIYSKFFSSNK